VLQIQPSKQLHQRNQNKKALPCGDRGSARGNLSILESVVLAAFAFAGMNSGLDDTVGDTQSEYGQGVPEPAMENQMSCVPDPFKVKRKHAFPPFDFLKT
jgi:hypothetical protein